MFQHDRNNIVKEENSLLNGYRDFTFLTGL